MTDRFIPRLICSLMLAVLAGLAQASDPAADGAASENQETYRKALQSIAEGRKDDAIRMLEQVIRGEAKHAGAWLDLALIRCALGQREEAERLFVHIEQNFDPPPGILELIAQSRAGGCAGWQPLSQTSVSIGRGLAQNVNQGTRANGTDLGLPVDLPVSDEFRPMHDQYNAVTVDYMRELTGNGAMGFAQFQGRRYDRLDDYNTVSLFVGAEAPWRVGDVTVRGSALAGLVTLGGQLYQRQAQAQVRATMPWTLPYGTKLQLSGSINHLQYLTLRNFDANTAELRGQLLYRDDALYATASASYMSDHAIADRPGGDRSGWLFSSLVRYQVLRDLTAELGASRQTWNNRTEYAPTLIDIVRRQRTNVWRGMLSYAVSRNQAIVVEGRLIRNSENITLFEYNDKQLQISWQWQSQ